MIDSQEKPDLDFDLEQDNTTADGRLALLVLGGLVFCWASHYMVNGDIWWHLRTGQLITQDGIPTTDWYTFASSDSKWIDLHWLFQVVVAWVHSLGGSEGLVLFKAVLSTVTVILLLMPFRKLVPSAVMILIAWPFISLYASRLLVRPEMLSFLFLVGTLFVIHKSTHHVRWLLALPLIQLLWVNCQGLFVLQYVVMFSFAAQVCWSQFIAKKPIFGDQSWKMTFILAGVLTGFATLLNPYGFEGARFPLELMEKMGGEHKQFYLEYAGEIRGLGDLIASNSIDKVLAIPAVLHVLFVAILTCCTLFLRGNECSNRTYHVCLLIAFAYLGWNMSRNDPLVGLVFCYITFSRIADAKALTMSILRSESQAISRFITPSAALLVAFLSYGAISGSYHQDEQSPFEKSPWYGESRIYPHDAAMFLNTLEDIDEIYADHELLAALCIYHMREDQRVFADARLEVNTKKALADMREVRRLLNRDIEEATTLLSSYGNGTKAIVFMNHSFFSPQLPNVLSNLARSEEWVCVYCDPYREDTGPSRFIIGATIFVPRAVSLKQQLPAVSVEHLLNRLQN